MYSVLKLINVYMCTPVWIEWAEAKVQSAAISTPVQQIYEVLE